MMDKTKVSEVMKYLNKRRNKKYDKKWRSDSAKHAAKSRWNKKDELP